MINKSRAPAAEAIRALAVPLTWIDGLPDPSPIISMIGSADVVGCGEPTHGDRESIILKQALVRKIASSRNRTLIAWERGVGNVRRVASSLDGNGGLPHACRRWIYPWVSHEVEDLFRWVRTADRDRPGAVTLCGVDMDGPPPMSVLDELAKSVGCGHAHTLANFRQAVSESQRSPEEERCYQAILTALRGMGSAASTLSPPDRLLLATTGQWAMHRLLELAESDTWDFGDTTASEFRDKCIADNLIEQRRIHDPDVVLLTAHNGHISRSRPMAGWHLRKAAGLDYFSLGIAFGVGSFNAGTARGGGFHPELKVFPADHPPEGSLEALLAAVGFSSFVVDLRHFRGTDHDLAYDMTCREVSLAGGAPQFELHAPPAEMYDGLIWLDRISPTTILREAGDFW